MPRERTDADHLTTRLTAFGSFEDLLDACGDYRPTIHRDDSPDHARLADAYDAAQRARGDARRAYPPSRASLLEDRPDGRLLARRAMARMLHRGDCIDGCGEAGATELAEAFAQRHDLYLDDVDATIPDWIFGVAAEVADQWDAPDGA